MLKLYRNILVGGLLAAGLAACGDKVTVTNPPPAPAVASVTVTPASVPLSIGQSVTLSASVVVADSATSTAVTWVSSNTAVATVNSATGVVTAVAQGTTTVIATSTADVHVSGAAVVTVSAAPPGLISFSVTPQTVILSPGQTVTATANTVVQTGVTAPAVSWASLNTAIATVGASTGVITAVSPGTAVVNASITIGTQTATASIQVTVSVASAASISINSINVTATGLPVLLSNVAGQIDVLMNFNPGNQQVDSLGVFILPSPNSSVPAGAKASNTQRYATNPSAGVIDVPIPTQQFGKNPTNATDTVYYTNGQRVLFVQIWVKNPAGGADVAINANNFIPFNLNNPDGWAADITKPSVNATSAAGLTYWGGPTANATAILYPVIYTSGRSLSTTTGTTWTIGLATGAAAFVGCPTTTQTFGAAAVAIAGTTGQVNQGTKQTFGYTANGAGDNCTSYENTTGVGGIRDNIQVSASIDNANNTYPLVLGIPGPVAVATPGATTLISNTVWFGGTPDSLRLDYKAPSVGTPSIARTAPAVTGWVNASFSFINFASTDNGVGLFATRNRATTYSAVKCGNGPASNAMATGTGADIPECPILVNPQGGLTATANGTAPYTVTGTESDRLNNVGTSTASPTFGVDKTAPSLRWGIVDASIPYVAAVNQAGTTDSIFTASKPVAGTNVFRAEFLDDRSGFYNNGVPLGGASAETQQLSTAGHLNPTGTCLIGTGTPGATFVTAPACGLVPTTVAGSLRLDGWQGGQQVNVPTPEGYYGYVAQVTDAAGNAAITASGGPVTRRVLVNTQAPFATGLGLPALLQGVNFPINMTAADSAEVINASLALQYPNVPTAQFLRYNQVAIGLFDDNVITSPFNGTLSPPGAPYARGVESVTGVVYSGVGVAPTNVAVAPTNLKPTSVQAWSFNPSNFFAPSALIAIPGLNVETGVTFNTFNTGNTNNSLTNFRVIATLATTNQFGSVVPLRAQALSPTGTPSSPFVRVDFFVLDAGGTWWNYLNSVQTTSANLVLTDDGTNRSWLYQLPSTLFLNSWKGATQSALATGNTVIAIGVTAAGDAIVSLPVTF